MFNFRNKIPPKPKTQKEQIDMLWDMSYNDLPCKIKWLDMKLNFIMAFMVLVLGLLGVLVYAIF